MTPIYSCRTKAKIESTDDTRLSLICKSLFFLSSKHQSASLKSFLVCGVEEYTTQTERRHGKLEFGFKYLHLYRQVCRWALKSGFIEKFFTFRLYFSWTIRLFFCLFSRATPNFFPPSGITCHGHMTHEVLAGSEGLNKVLVGCALGTEKKKKKKKSKVKRWDLTSCHQLCPSSFTGSNQKGFFCKLKRKKICFLP